MEEYLYNIFKTRWGWFGLVGSKRGLVRTCLPMARKEAICHLIQSDFQDTRQSKRAFSALEKRIIAYYTGVPDDFDDVEICISQYTVFQQRVLATLRSVTHGKKISYGQLATLSGSPKAARAIGSVMAVNPMPLIIPCHRVIKADGRLGHFSAPGGANTKKRMLELENKA